MAEQGDASEAEIRQIVERWHESCRSDQLVMRGDLPDARSELPAALIESARNPTVSDLRVRREARSLANGISVETGLRQAFLLGRVLTADTYRVDAERLVAVLGSAAEAICQAHVETAERQAMTDELTGIGNDRGFRLDLDGAIARVARGAGSFALAMVDLDGLKVVNDEHGGHLAGDQYIRQFSRQLQDFVRPERGRVFRYGGDEFTVIFRDVDRESVESILARFAEDTAIAPFCYGVADCPADSDDGEQLLAIADEERLYEMKETIGKVARTARAQEWIGSEHWEFTSPAGI